jgi:hypothetical protein
MAETITVAKVMDGLYEIRGVFQDETDPADYFKRSDLYPPPRRPTERPGEGSTEAGPTPD